MSKWRKVRNSLDMGPFGRHEICENKRLALDMWPAFIESAEQMEPKAEIVFDRFLIYKHLNEAVELKLVAEPYRSKYGSPQRTIVRLQRKPIMETFCWR